NSWTNAQNWTTKKVPGATEHACIPAGKTAEVLEVAKPVLTVNGAGTLVIAGGELKLTSTTEGSSIANLEQSSGILGGKGTLTVSGTFTWSAGSQSEEGKTVIASGGSLSITG